MGSKRKKPERPWRRNFDTVDIPYCAIAKSSSKRIYFDIEEVGVKGIDREEIHWVDEWKNLFRVAIDYAEEIELL